MVRTKKFVLLALAVSVLIAAAIPLASLATAALPFLFAPLASGDSATVFFSVAGAFGVAYVIAVPRDSNKPR